MDPITLSLSPQQATLALIAVLTALVLGILMLMGRKGAIAPATGWLLPTAQALSVVMFGFAIVAASYMLWSVISAPADPAAPAPGLGAGAVIVALLGAPFLIWRSVVAQRTVDLAAESLLNDKLNAAATELAARRQVTRSVEQDGKEAILTEWQDDLVTRAAAIDRLEGLANEHPGIAPRVANLLSVYVRELSAEFPPQEPPFVMDDVIRLDWAHDLKAVRSDIHKAGQTLGRLRRINGVDLAQMRLDLRGANLQGFDLEGLDLGSANLRDARLEGANLRAVCLNESDVSEAELDGADLSGAQLGGTSLILTSGIGTLLDRVRIDETTRLTAAYLRAAALRNSDWSTAAVVQNQINQTFGDASVTLPPNVMRPENWPRRTLQQYEFFTEWRKWRANPITYTPPD